MRQAIIRGLSLNFKLLAAIRAAREIHISPLYDLLYITVLTSTILTSGELGLDFIIAAAGMQGRNNFHYHFFYC